MKIINESFTSFQINEISFWIVPLIFGLIPILGAVFCFWLPETMNCKLPETIEDAENFKK